jgi:hypothetical protein
MADLDTAFLTSTSERRTSHLDLNDSEIVTGNFDKQSGNPTIISLDASTPISLALYRKPQCRKLCCCRCHKRKRISRSYIASFNSIGGSLQVIHSDWTFTAQHCDVDSCRNASIESLEILYTFPRWSSQVSVRAHLSIRGGFPSAGLALERRIPPDNISQSHSLTVYVL